MIEIDRDWLSFSFPSINAEIKSLLEAYVAEMLPSFLLEYPEMVVKELVEDKPYCYGWRGLEEKVRTLVLALSEKDIEKMLLEEVQKAAGYYDCRMAIRFVRTFRIPDDGKTYLLPPSLDCLPLQHVDDFAGLVPEEWLKRGGVMLPMYQAEALWMNLGGAYPFALKIAAGKINAISGEIWEPGLRHEPQDYLVVPGQDWLEGFAVAEGVVRQFVAMPLGAGYSVEEQLTGRAEFGGLQFEAIPMKARKYYETQMLPKLPTGMAQMLDRVLSEEPRSGGIMGCSVIKDDRGMGISVGGRVSQKIYKDPYAAEDWDRELSSRCFMHLCDAVRWREITGVSPDHAPYTATNYQERRLPWFDYYRDDLAVLEGSKTLAQIPSVNAIHVANHGCSLNGKASMKVPFLKRTVSEWKGE